ncbi:MAG: transcription antitermination factor NusB, partial [Actinobacteria bacterium]|nr:transcription antitermination factor NusB [Actinomycetota bacterium]
MSARSKARKRALDILFEADLRSSSATDLLELRPPQDLSQGEYSEALIRGVSDHREKIDELIVTYAQDWDMDRMPAIDRNILRISIYEILWCPEIDDAVAVSQAVEMATELSTEKSPSYINGVLG